MHLYASIPKPVLSSTELSSTEKLVVGCLRDIEYGNELVRGLSEEEYPSGPKPSTHAVIAEMLGLPPIIVHDSLRILATHGLVFKDDPLPKPDEWETTPQCSETDDG